ncbi:hypothetical protein C7271_15935 [filamentous cyanobacterium CCP5]|nr:hypothetical protein C7271_15935 [filamentous cyanobacterium CCP5]
MKTRLKPVELFLAAGLAMTVGACGGPATDEPGSTEEVAPTTEEVAPDATEEAAPDAEATPEGDEGGEGGEG